MNSLKSKINHYLDNRFTPSIKKLVVFNALMTLLLGVFSLMVIHVDTLLFWIFCGSFFAFWNFFFMALFIQKYLHFNKINTNQTRFFVVKQVFFFNLRLFITGFFLYTMLVTWNANPFALVVGLSIPVASIPILLILLRKN